VSQKKAADGRVNQAAENPLRPYYRTSLTGRGVLPGRGPAPAETTTGATPTTGRNGRHAASFMAEKRHRRRETNNLPAYQTSRCPRGTRGAVTAGTGGTIPYAPTTTAPTGEEQRR